MYSQGFSQGFRCIFNSFKISGRSTVMLLLIFLLFGLFNLRQTVDFTKENEIDIVYSVSVAKKLYGCTLQRNMNKQKLYRNMLLYFLIMLCGDVESCPGPGLNDVCNIKGLKLCHLNIQGLSTSHEGLCEVLTSNPELDIITLSETHLSTNLTGIPELLYGIPGFTFIFRNRENGKGGGVAMYIKNNFVWERRADLDDVNIENMWIELHIKNSSNILISSIYRPPNGSKFLSKDFFDYFESNLSLGTSETKEVIIMGDLNVNYLKTKDDSDIKNLLTTFGFTQGDISMWAKTCSFNLQ